jgi:hypothetical protein
MMYLYILLKSIISHVRVSRPYIISFRKIYKMSQGNSAARKRRAGGASFEPQNPPQAPRSVPGQQTPANGLTLPQVIAVVDARLIKLETFMKDTQSKGPVQAQTHAQAPVQAPSDDILSEFDEKFEVLANEIADLKDIVLKLQSYTMDVNKMLMEERINVLSDMGETELVSVDTKKEVTFNLTEVDNN